MYKNINDSIPLDIQSLTQLNERKKIHTVEHHLLRKGARI